MQYSRKTVSFVKTAGLGLALLAAALPQAAQAQSNSLSTTYASNNSGREGFYFDLSATKALSVNSFDVNVGSSQMVDVYTRSGSFMGNEGTSGWTLLGSQMVVSKGTNAPSLLSVGGLSLKAGQTDGVYMFFDGNSGDVNYTNGSQTVCDPNLSVFASEANFSRFGTGSSEIANRVWNGSVNYSLTATPTPEPSSVAAFAFTALGAAALVLKARKRRLA